MLDPKRNWDFETSSGNLFLPGDTPRQKAGECILISTVKNSISGKGYSAGPSWGGEARGPLPGQVRSRTYPSPIAVQGDTHLQKSHLFFPTQKPAVVPCAGVGVQVKSLPRAPKRDPFKAKPSSNVCQESYVPPSSRLVCGLRQIKYYYLLPGIPQ